jgi:hypothetical protein
MAMFSGEHQEVSPLKLGHEIELVAVQIPEVDLRLKDRSGEIRKSVVKFLFLPGIISLLSGSSAGRHFFG